MEESRLSQAIYILSQDLISGYVLVVVFNLNDNDFLFSVQDESANTDYPTAYLLHYEFDWEELTEQKQTKLDIVWCSSNYIIDYTSGYQAYRANVRKNIIEAICKYERKRKNRTSPRYN